MQGINNHASLQFLDPFKMYDPSGCLLAFVSMLLGSEPDIDFNNAIQVCTLSL